jgi:hypothetical protein
MNPSYDSETLQAYFQPVSDATMADPVLGPILQQLAQDDPDLIAAVADVDRSQVRDSLALTPEQRVQQAFNLARSLDQYRHVRG